MPTIYKMAETFGLTYEVTEAAEPHYVPKDSPMVQKLLAVYRQVTGIRQRMLLRSAAELMRKHSERILSHSGPNSLVRNR
jgi:acetylornithine deacetylase/succinyl-diaminopimelate desuccinylase-like protein